MLRKLLLLAIIATTPVMLWAQADTKTTENTPHPNMDYKQMGAPMPQLSFMAYRTTQPAEIKEKQKRKRKKNIVDSAVKASYYLTSAQKVGNDGNLFVMMFNPTCGHCENVAANMRDSIALFQKSKIILLANGLMKPYIPEFVERLNIINTPNMHVGYDSSDFINKLFLYQALPQINIYSTDRKLLKTYCGEVTIDSLKKYID